jgi:hypothetical protein
MNRALRLNSRVFFARHRRSAPSSSSALVPEVSGESPSSSIAGRALAEKYFFPGKRKPRAERSQRAADRAAAPA